MQIRRLAADDFENTMDFLNLVFSQAHSPHDFAKLLPRLYRPTDECMRWNMAVTDNERIRAIVGLYPATLYIGDAALKLGGIGAVSSHPNDRGKGWMRLLMNRCIDEMQQEGYDLSFLGGQRQRYMHFGYEKAGILLEYKVSKSNLCHSQDIDPASLIRFKPMLPTDLQHIAQAKALYDAQPIRCLRPSEDFYLYLLSWNMKPWVALYADGSMAGYLVASPELNSISEFFAVDKIAYSGMVRAWIEQQNIPEARITLPCWAQDNAHILGGIAESAQILDSGNWQIFDWQKVVGALLQVKNSLHQLQNGTLCIGIAGYGSLCIHVQKGVASCEKTSIRPDVEWDSFLAMRVLFGQVLPGFVTEIPRFADPLVASWFPLPLSWLPQDHV